jgi:polyferredoxin
LRLPKWIDIPLRSLKYLLLGLFLYAVASLSTGGLASFLESPYGLVADVKMLNFFRYLTPGAAVFIGFLVFTSLFIQNAWCRYLCPYGALMGIAALASPARIRRNPAACIDCAKCAKACPSHLPVNTLVQIRSSECLGCLECVAACPSEDALAMTLASPAHVLRPRAMALAIGVVFVSAWLAARLTGHWESAISPAAYHQLIPQARHLDHPR